MAKIDRSAAAIVQGIQTIGVGRRGSRDLEPDLTIQIVADLRAGNVTPVAEGAFWGALAMKGVSEAETALREALPAGCLDSPDELAAYACADTPAEIQQICARLLAGQTLDTSTSRTLGHFLFSDEPGEKARGLVASLLRVRYETADEYEGLLAAMRETVAPPFQPAPPAGPPIAQVAEPFDGVLRSHLLTPLIADYLQQRKYRAVSLLGRSSGPKRGMNHASLHRALGGRFAERSADISGTPDGGWAIDQAALSPAMDAWVARRREARKRPFLATLEKFLDPCRASLLITSAFHPPYTEKMATVAERAGFPAAIVMRRGIEGTLTPNAARPVEVLCTVRGADGAYTRAAFEWSPEELLGEPVMREANVEDPDTETNAARIRAYRADGASGDALFDRRVALAHAVIGRALNWIEQA